MAGFTTARDGIYALMQTITGASSGFYKVGYRFDKRDITDAAGQGYPFYTVSPSFDKNRATYRGTVNNWEKYTIVVRVFALYEPTEASETAFLTLLDRTLTTLEDNDNITLNGTVSHCLVEDIRPGYNDAAQPTLRIAEIDCLVTLRRDRTA